MAGDAVTPWAPGGTGPAAVHSGITADVHAGRDAFVAGRDVNVYQGMPAVPARSVYLAEVRQIAPKGSSGQLDLRDRDAELAELARFCLDPGGPSYVWWQAGPWAGKSALLSTFVLHPPAEVASRVTLVSFFVTARRYAQDTARAFSDVMVRELAALTGQPEPPALPEAVRDGYLLELMSQAAAKCHDDGGRLVLVVDGLDEDRGVTTGPAAHSIAGLLPAGPPSGMRVIVSGRPSPPVPDDVPDWHPLRDPAIIRPLRPSPHAHDVRRLSRRELHGLLHGTTADRDILGLLAAARGGLSAADLAGLAAIPLWEVEDITRTAAGRTLQARPGLYAGPEVYLLAHEELQAAAVAYLGDGLGAYRDRLHAWAGGYRARNWPPDTPEYLLAGYFRLLEDTGDLPGMTRCALDAARQDRMLTLTGGDAAAIAEARATLDRIAAQDVPDLASALAIACRRDHLALRSMRIPLNLPAAWAALGQVTRALAQATSIVEPDEQASALAGVAVALAESGQQERAAVIAAQAEELASSITTPNQRAVAMADVVEATARAGRWQEAEALARSITGQAAGAATEVAADWFSGEIWGALALARVAEALATGGQQERAAVIAAQAEAEARAIADAAEPDSDTGRVAALLARPGPHWQAWSLQNLLSDQAWDAEKLPSVVAALPGPHAEALVAAVTSPAPQAFALAVLARTLTAAGQHDRAAAIAAQAESVARSAADPGTGERALSALAGALGIAGQFRQAEELAGAITDPAEQALALTDLAGYLADAGQPQESAAVALRAEALALSLPDSASRLRAMAAAAVALARAGQPERAIVLAEQVESAARSVTDSFEQFDAPAMTARAWAGTGQYERALGYVLSLEDPYSQALPLAEVVKALARAGQPQRAQTLARLIHVPGEQDEALAAVVEGLATAGRHAEAESLARSLDDFAAQPSALIAVAKALAADGQSQRAEALIRSLPGQFWQGIGLGEVAEALAKAGHAVPARRLAATACTCWRWENAAAPVLLLAPDAYPVLARTLADQGSEPAARR